MIYASDGYHRIRAPIDSLEDAEVCLWRPDMNDHIIPDGAWVPFYESELSAMMMITLDGALAIAAREHADAVLERQGEDR